NPKALLPLTNLTTIADELMIDAESFSERGGWVIDQQSMDQMGSPYFMAHGLGEKVKDAHTQIKITKGGKHRVWVRTRDWVGKWKKPGFEGPMKATGSPGVFHIKFNNQPLKTTFGKEGAEWHWQDGGTIDLKTGEHHLTLHDLTGFNGRCDVILLTDQLNFTPGDSLKEIQTLRDRLLPHQKNVNEKGHYDVIVVGGGMAGICTAITSARYGCKVVLIQDRPVLGGNNSSEVRVGLSGLIRQKPYTELGNLVDQLGPIGHWTLWDANKRPSLERSKQVKEIIRKHPEKKTHNAGPASNYDDNKKLKFVQAEKNITLFLSTRANAVEMKDGKIAAVLGQNIQTGEKIRVTGAIVVDCTGDGNIAALAKADFRIGRESKAQTQEDLAPSVEDNLVMGTSVQWNTKLEKQPSSFPKTPWAIGFTTTNCVKATHGDWNWETGSRLNHATQMEEIRDYALRVVYGNWSVIKNNPHPNWQKRFGRRKLSWVAYIGGKRESRRIMGDVILKQQDIVNAKPFPDASVTTTWTIDLHYPAKPTCACDAFQSKAEQLKIKPYPIPYRCSYSRNVPNLMMAGRNISVTHVALGTVRVMRTTGMMGEVVGMANSIIKKHQCLPKDVYTNHLPELKKLMTQGVPSAPRLK
ncbi:MAG: FAD-dependent oxidoreductase, partial [Akkermansiaceae bacterium]